MFLNHKLPKWENNYCFWNTCIAIHTIGHIVGIQDTSDMLNNIASFCCQLVLQVYCIYSFMALQLAWHSSCNNCSCIDLISKFVPIFKAFMDFFCSKHVAFAQILVQCKRNETQMKINGIECKQKGNTFIKGTLCLIKT